MNLLDISNSEIDALIGEWIHSDRDRAIMRSRLIDGWTYERIADAFDLSTQRVKTIVYRSMDRLCTKIK